MCSGKKLNTLTPPCQVSLAAEASAAQILHGHVRYHPPCACVEIADVRVADEPSQPSHFVRGGKGFHGLCILHES